ncbi:MAG: alpha/beta hydrolase [Flavobacteriaceae bacterium]|nr:alpha/beta hydrolase [Flavobacteriaceae bacterium]
MTKIPIYFVPGLGANPKIFEYLEFPEDQFQINYLDWLVPESLDEPLQNYARRMCKRIEHDSPVLVGVSFGGVMVQEMSKLIKTKKTIIVSSVKSKKELPKRLRLARVTKAYKLFPTKSLSNISVYEKYAFSGFTKKRVELYKKYMSMNDELYLPWAIHNVLHWNQEHPMENIIHIHGSEDGVFPVKHIKGSVVVEGGTHVMILNKAKKISQLLMEHI